MSKVEEEVEEETVVPVEGEATEEEESSTPSDPLDAIKDEDDRALAKKERAISSRLAKKKEAEVTPPEKVTAPESTFATKDDLKKIATNDAKKLLAPEVLAVWDDLTGIPLGGYDPMDADAIAKNMAKRYQLFRQDNPIEGEDPLKGLITSPQVSASGGKTPDKKSAPLPGFKEAVHPDNWYPAKE